MPRNEGEYAWPCWRMRGDESRQNPSQMESLLTLMNADSERNLSRAGAAPDRFGGVHNAARSTGFLRLQQMGLGAKGPDLL